MPKLTADLTALREMHEDETAILTALARTLNAITEVTGLAVAQCDQALHRGRHINRGYGALAGGRHELVSAAQSPAAQSPEDQAA